MYSQPIDQPFFCKEAKTGLCVLCEGCVTNDPGSLQYKDPNCTVVVQTETAIADVQVKCACE